MVVLRAIEVLAVGRMPSVVIFRVLDIEVGDPAELAINVTLLRHLCVVRHASALHVVLLVRVQLALWVHQDPLLVLEVFVEVLLWAEVRRVSVN